MPAPAWGPAVALGPQTPSLLAAQLQPRPVSDGVIPFQLRPPETRHFQETADNAEDAGERGSNSCLVEVWGWDPLLWSNQCHPRFPDGGSDIERRTLNAGGSRHLRLAAR